jgi:hypothetical protein
MSDNCPGPYEADRQAAASGPRDDRPITDFLWSADAPEEDPAGLVDVLLVKGADEGVCLHAGQVCVETESCGCPCSFCLAELDEARQAEEDPAGE